MKDIDPAKHLTPEWIAWANKHSNHSEDMREGGELNESTRRKARSSRSSGRTRLARLSRFGPPPSSIRRREQLQRADRVERTGPARIPDQMRNYRFCGGREGTHRMTATDDIRLISQGAPDPALISPARDSRYSTSLYLHLKRLQSSQRARYTGWREVNGSIWVGYRDRAWFFGERLAKVLQEPSVTMVDPRRRSSAARWLDAIVRLRSSLFDIPRPRRIGNHFRPIDNFWEGYLQQGRCFFDPEHKLEFSDYLNPNKGWRSLLRPIPLIREERWATSLADDPRVPNVVSERVCKWCGHRQVLRKRTEPVTVGRTEWISASEAPAAKT